MRTMKEKSRIIYLVLIMTALVFAVSGVTFYTQYQAAIKEELKWLTYTVQTQARLIEAVAGFDAKYSAEEKDYPEGPFAATLSQIEAAHKSLIGFGKTGEFTLGKREGDKIVFLLSHRHSESGKYHTIPLGSIMAEPMRRALEGKSGAGMLLDYRGATVLAAHEPVAVLNRGFPARRWDRLPRGVLVAAHAQGRRDNGDSGYFRGRHGTQTRGRRIAPGKGSGGKRHET